MSQNVLPRLPPTCVPSGVIGHLSRSSAGVNSGSDSMNHANNSQPTPWGHSTNASSQNVGVVTCNQHGAAPGTPSAVDFDKATALPSPQSSSSSQGTTLKEHDLLGLSDVSSSNAASQDNSAQGDHFPHEGLNLNLNLGATELRLGPQDEKPSSGFQGSSSALETGNFLGLDAGSKSLDAETMVQDRRSANVDPSGANSEQQQDKGMDRGFGYSSLSGDRVPTQQVGRADMMVNSGCRPLIESGSLQKWHGADLMSANGSLGLNMSSSLQQSLRPPAQDDMSEKTFERSYNEDRQELTVPHQQHAPADEHQVYSEWRERKQQNVAQDDVSSSEKGSAQDQMMVAKANPSDVREGVEVHDRMDLEAYPVDKRNFADCKALLALQLPEQRYQQDKSIVPSPRHSEYVGQQTLWQSQMLMRPQMGVAEFQNQPQQISYLAKDENSRNGFSCSFPGPRGVFAVANKPGVSGAKRPYDTIGTAPDARIFNESRVSSVSETPSMINSNSANSDGEAKSKVQPPSYVPWGGNRAPTWQMLHSGGSFGPFPSQAPGRNQVMSTKPAVEAASVVGEITPKVWEAHTKSLQQQQDASVSICSQKMGSCPSENKPSPAQAFSPPSESGSAQRVPAPTSHAVGWPPLRSHRKNSIAAHPRPSPVETQQVRPPPPPQAASPASVASQPNSCLVKVYMDGVPFGRKVDLKSSNCSYEKLSVVLEGMFRAFVNGQQNPRELTLPSDKRNFLHGSDYVLTYEDQDGDLMLVGDVPWMMFIDTVKRLRIMKGSEAIGLGNRSAEKASKLQPTV